MIERWTENDPTQIARLQSVWDALASGDIATALDANSDDVIVENGPGAGPWRRTDGKNAYVDMAMKFVPLFGDSWQQTGTCIFANEQFAVSLVTETGVHAASGDVFENRAVYITRFGKDGKTERLWTVDLDSEDMERFWERNPVAER